jgi:hypothetical protein
MDDDYDLAMKVSSGLENNNKRAGSQKEKEIGDMNTNKGPQQAL